MAAQADRGIPLSTLCPKYLHSNSTSHTWPFSAIAELIDNAYDPDVSAKQFWIDKTFISGQHCLIFMDNGKGLDLKTMHKMLSFGYSDKVAANGFQPIGIYGNGFKSGSMRLGKDAIVFSKSRNALCVGMLSQTYLEEIGAQQIIVPIICFEQKEPNIFSVSEEHQPSLKDILRYSPFKSEAELLTEVNIITSTWPSEKTGTRIIIWNLRRTSTTESEFDFQKDRYDIRIPSEAYEAVDPPPGRAQGTRDTSTPESRYSLRAYCSILYLKPRMQIIIRGQKVKSQLVKKSLAYVMKDSYRPSFLPRRVPINFGYNTRSKDQYGIMMYHKNRLIKAYERVGCQLKGNYQGVGVIGVIECNFLEPTHNKQSFMDTDKYRRTMTNLATKLDDYWKQMVYKRKIEDPNSTIPVEDTTKRPDQNWVQCDDCLKWRKLPDGIDCSKLPEKWSCHMNPDPQFRSCKVEEEPEDSDDEQTSYPKTYKIQERKEKQRVAEQKQREEDMRRRQHQEHVANLTKTTQALQRQLRQTQKEKQLGLIRRKGAVNPQHEIQGGRRGQSTANSPGIPTTPKSRLNSSSAQGGAAGAECTPQISSVVSQAACSVPTKDGLPVIASVCSLSPVVTGKRTKLQSPETTPKRPRLNGHHQVTPNASTTPDVSPLRPQPVRDDGNDTDDDLIIMETVSTPKPKDTGFDLAKVKSEDEQSDCSVSLLLEFSDDVDTDGTLHTSGTKAACEATQPPDTASITTQTEVPKIKEESESGKGEGRKEVTLQSGDATSATAATTTTATTTTDTTTATAALNQSEESEASVADTSGTADIPELCQSSKEAQEQQDWLLELMQTTALERDELKGQLHQLTCQLQDAQSRLQAPPPVIVKKECSHQGVQTEEQAPEKDYKDLFERARQRVDELIRDKQDLLAAREADEAAARAKEDTNAAEVESLVKELEQRDKEKEEMRLQLDKLSLQCEELQQQQRDMTQEETSAQQNPGTSTSGTALDMSRSLMQLRQNIGQLLVPFVPALDLGQVNFECNVIDEILEQVVSNPEIVAAMEQRLEAIHGQM